LSAVYPVAAPPRVPTGGANAEARRHHVSASEA